MPFDVVQAADDSGSTEYIINQVKNGPVGSVWGVGTEIHLVNRLAHQVQPERTVYSLDQFGCLCSTMFRVSPNHLLWVLEGLLNGEVHNHIVVPEEQKRWTRVALDRMLRQLRLAGKFAGVRAIVFGEMLDCVQNAEQGYRIEDVLAECTAGLGIPVMFGLQSGHSPSGNLTLPLGAQASLDAGRGLLRIEEAAVVD